MSTAPRYKGSFDANGRGTLTVIVDHKPLTFSSDHPHWDRLLDDVTHGRIPLDTDFEIVLEAIPGVTVSDGILYLDGFPVHDKLAETIKRYHREGRDTTNLTRFAERIQHNPSDNSVEALFTWAAVENDLTIDENGYIIGFKSVTPELRSHSIGPAIVDGEFYDPDDSIERDDYGSPIGSRKGVPNTIGAVVEMDRDDVDPDTNVGCSTGLHFGTWSYARNFGGGDSIVLEVRVDPADVVSVPDDCSFQKVRCCRYEVVEIHDFNGVLNRYEPEATNEEESPEAREARIAENLRAQNVPPTFVQRILGRFRNN